MKINAKITKIRKNKKGSALVLMVLVMVNALIIAMAITTISVLEKKSNSKIKRSTPAIQAANSGLEWAQGEIARANPDARINEIFPGYGDNGIFHRDSNSNVYFISEEVDLDPSDGISDTIQNIITNPDELIDEITRIRTVGKNGIAEEAVYRSMDAIASTKCQRGFKPVADFCIQADDYWGPREIRPGGGWRGVEGTGVGGRWTPGAAEACAKNGGRLCSVAERIAALCENVDIIEALNERRDVNGEPERFDEEGEMTSDLAWDSNGKPNMVVIDVGSKCNDVKLKKILMEDDDSNREKAIAYRCCMNR